VVNPQNKSAAKMIAAMAVALHLAGSRFSLIFGFRLERRLEWLSKCIIFRFTITADSLIFIIRLRIWWNWQTRYFEVVVP
jgi:hypothetical protein